MCPNLRLPPYHRLNLSPEPLKQHLHWSIEFHFQSIPQRMKRKTQPTKQGRHQSASNTTIPKASLSLLLQTGKQKTRQKASLHFFKKSECSEASIAPQKYSVSLQNGIIDITTAGSSAIFNVLWKMRSLMIDKL